MEDSDRLLQAHRKLNSLLRELALGAKLEDFLQHVIQAVESCLSGSIASILHFDATQNSLHCRVPNRLPQSYNDAIEGVIIGPTVGCCGAAAALKTAVIAEDINTHPNWQPYLALSQAANLHACWSIPVLNSQGEVFGTFAIYHNFPKAPSQADMEVLELAALVTSVAIEKAELEEQLHFAATHDELTHLYNRTFFNQTSEQLLEQQQQGQHSDKLTIMFLDLNNFKRVNDKYGHHCGDKLLQQIAENIKAAVREGDIAARFGGDEFVVLMPTNSRAEAENIARRILADVTQHCSQQYLDIGFGISIGIADNSGNKKLSLSDLISQADKAMYDAKRQSLGLVYIN